MADEREKRDQVERYLRSAKKFLGHEEEKRRRNEARERRRGIEDARPRRQEWDAEAGDEAGDEAETPAFEKIKRAAPGRVPAAPTLDPDLPRATVAAIHRGHLVLEDGRTARLSGRLAADPELRLAVGDEVACTDHAGVARIEGLLPRRSRLARADPGNTQRELVIAANVDAAAIVVAAKDPPLRPGLVDRYLIELARGAVAAVLVVNKIDLLDEAGLRELERVLLPYRELALPIVLCAASSGAGLENLRAELQGKTSVFVGHSGVGKSSLLNALDPEGARDTGAVRTLDGRGRHTTTSSCLRTLGPNTRIIDTPGVRAFGLDALTPAEVRAGFPEFEPFARDCRFADCTHAREPDCGVRAAADEERLSRARYAAYLRIMG